MFHLFQTYVVSVSSGSYKVDLDVAYTCMLQAYVSIVSYVGCKYVIQMLHMFCNDYKRVFLVFQTYVASVAATCCSCWARLHARGCGVGASVRAWATVWGQGHGAAQAPT
jgi:hypothetical protein